MSLFTTVCCNKPRSLHQLFLVVIQFRKGTPTKYYTCACPQSDHRLTSQVVVKYGD